MKLYKKIICIALLLITAALMFIPAATVFDDALTDARKNVSDRENDLTMALNKLDRDSVIFDEVDPYIIAGDLSPEEKSEKIKEIAAQREEQNKQDKENGVKKDDRTKLIPEDLVAFLVDEMTWEEFYSLSTKQYAPEKKIAMLAEFGIEITANDLNKRNAERDAEMEEVFAALNEDQVMQIRTRALDDYYSIQRDKDDIAAKEEKLEEARVELAQMEGIPMEELGTIALLPNKLPVSERQDSTKKEVDGKKVDALPEDVELNQLQINAEQVNKSNGYPKDGMIGNFHILTWIAFALLIVSACLILLAGSKKDREDSELTENIKGSNPSILYTIASFANLIAIILIAYSILRLQALPLRRFITIFDEKEAIDKVKAMPAVIKMNPLVSILMIALPIIALAMHIQSVHNTKRSMIYVFCTLLSAMALLPFWIMMVNATRTSQAIQQGVSLIPGKNLAVNWHVLETKNFRIDIGFRNSAIIAFSATILSVYFSAMTAYGFKVYRFKGNKFLYAVVMAIIMIPGQVTGTGFYIFMYQLGLTNNFIPLIIPAIAAASTVFFFRQYLEANFQVSLVEAARIDGCGEFRTFNKIVLPIMVPAMATMGIMSVIGNWNNYLTPLMLLSKSEMKTLPMLVKELRGDIYKTEYGSIYLGLTMTALPLIIVYFVFSKYIIAGVALGGVKE